MGCGEALIWGALQTCQGSLHLELACCFCKWISDYRFHWKKNRRRTTTTVTTTKTNSRKWQCHCNSPPSPPPQKKKKLCYNVKYLGERSGGERWGYIIWICVILNFSWHSSLWLLILWFIVWTGSCFSLLLDSSRYPSFWELLTSCWLRMFVNRCWRAPSCWYVHITAPRWSSPMRRNAIYF